MELRPPTRWSARLILAATLVLAPTPTAMAQEHREHYRRALDAMEAGRWNDAIPHLRRAIDARSEENKGAFRRYVPYYQLGLAYYRLGNCPTALEIWAESRSQGVVQTLPQEWATLQAAENNCSRQVSTVELEGAIDEALVARYAVEALLKAPGARPTPGEAAPGWRRKYDAALRQLEVSQSIRDEADPSAARVLEGTQLAAGAHSLLKEVEVELTQTARARQVDLHAQRTELEALVSDAEQALTSLPALDPLPPGLDSLRGKVTAHIQIARNANSTDTAVAQALADLQDSLDALRRASAGPPRELVQAARAYLKQDYQAALDALDGVSYRSNRARAHVHLLRSATLYALWVRGGESDAELLSAAGDEARLSRSRSASITPKETVLSPRYVRWYATVLEQPAAAPLPLARQR